MPHSARKHANELQSAAPCVCGRLRRASRALTRIYDEALADSGLTVTQFGILRTLTVLQAPTLAELADATAHEKSGLWRTMQPLIRSGAVTSGPIEGRRGVRLRLTTEGRVRFAAAQSGWSEAQTRVGGVLGSRRNQLMALLSEIEALG